jgi:ABC-type Fe3+-hydroxamate transport system substrate-binding protein
MMIKKKIIRTLNPMIIIIAIIFFVIYLSDVHTGIKDYTKREIKRVVSLSPAITREMIDLDSEDLLVGVTSYHPPLKKKIEIVGSLIQPSIEAIISLKPDIILFSMEDNPIQSIERFDATGIATHIFGRNGNFEEICTNYLSLAEILGKKRLATTKIEHYRRSLKRVEGREYTIAVFISHNPLITASGNSYVGRVIEDAGGINCFDELDVPYPIISTEFITVKNPDIIISIIEGTENFFKNKLKNFQFIGAIKDNNIYSISPDRIAFYTPRDYVASVKEVSEIIRRADEKHQ